MHLLHIPYKFCIVAHLSKYTLLIHHKQWNDDFPLYWVGEERELAMIGRSFANIQHTYNYAHWACMCGGLADTLCCLCGTSITNTLGLGVLLPFFALSGFLPRFFFIRYILSTLCFFCIFRFSCATTKEAMNHTNCTCFHFDENYQQQTRFDCIHVAQVLWPVFWRAHWFTCQFYLHDILSGYVTCLLQPHNSSLEVQLGRRQNEYFAPDKNVNIYAAAWFVHIRCMWIYQGRLLCLMEHHVQGISERIQVSNDSYANKWQCHKIALKLYRYIGW